MHTPTAAPPAPEVAGELDRIVGARAVRAVFQPLVDLDSGDVVAYEALARGPAGSPLEPPAALFETAYGSVRVAELDWACRAAAFAAAAGAGLDPSLRLFVNCEPVSLGVPCPDDLWPVVDAAERRLRVVSWRSPSGPWPATRPGCWPRSRGPGRSAGGLPWTTSAPRRAAWPCCPSSTPT